MCFKPASEGPGDAWGTTYGHRETDADVVLTEYVVAVRTKPGGRAEPALSGWVPICSIAVVANDLVHKQLKCACVTKWGGSS